MTIKHQTNGRPFSPRAGGGGSRPGKPQGRWPMVIKVAADAVLLRPKGTMDAWVIDRRRPMPDDQFCRQMELALPGVWTYAEEKLGSRNTSLVELLYNRVYKMYYSGTSDRGSRHDPKTRACQSQEHWLKKVPTDSPLRDIHDKLLRGTQTTIPDWKDLLT